MDGMQNFNLPQPVQVIDTASAEDFHRKLRMRESALHEALEENETVTMELHTPAGEIIRVQDVGYYQDTDTLAFQGFDDANNLCQIIAKVQGLQVLFRVIRLAEDQSAKRIGFYAEEPQREHEQIEQTEEAAPSHRRQELMELLASAGTPTQVAVARGAADSWLADHPSDGDVRAARDRLADVNPTGD
jgi:hypothetical protein